MANAPALFTLRPTKQTCAILGAAIGLLLAGGGGLYFWQSGELAAMRTQVELKQEEARNKKRIADRLTAVEATYGETLGKLRYLESSVSPGEYVPTLLRQTEGLAKSVNLTVDSVRPTWEPAPEPPKTEEEKKTFKPQPYDKIHVDMQVRGSYWNVAKMLYRLTEFPKILAVEGMTAQVNSQEKANKSPQLTVNLKLTGFVFPMDGLELEKMNKASSGPRGPVQVLSDQRQRKEASFEEAGKK